LPLRAASIRSCCVGPRIEVSGNPVMTASPAPLAFQIRKRRTP
jgi:hypothetical protein